MSFPTYQLTLHKTYYEKGFFNLGVDVERYVTAVEGLMMLNLGGRSSVQGRVTRQANMNGTPRVFGGAALRDWFMANFDMNDVVVVTVLTPTELSLSRA